MTKRGLQKARFRWVETICETEIEDTVTGKTGKGVSWNRDKADSKACNDLKGK